MTEARNTLTKRAFAEALSLPDGACGCACRCEPGDPHTPETGCACKTVRCPCSDPPHQET